MFREGTSPFDLIKRKRINISERRSIDNSNASYFSPCCEKAHNHKEFSQENSKPCCESHITTHSQPVKSNPAWNFEKSSMKKNFS